MNKIFIVLLLWYSLIFTFTDISQDSIVMDKCKNGQDVIAKFIFTDLARAKIFKDTIYDTGSVIVYIPSLKVYYVTKRDNESVKYDAEIYKLVGNECINPRN